MTQSDAEVSQAVIRRFQAKLASAGTLPVRSLRRNSSEYPLVCYINNVTALFVSENWEAVPIFVARAAEHMIARPADDRLHAYYTLAGHYLSQIVHHLMVYVGGVEFDRERIPSAIMTGGPQQPPG